MNKLDSVESINAGLATHNYIATARLCTAVFLAHKLEKPVLIEGPAGVGKTELAKQLAFSMGVALNALEFLVAGLQAYVFAILTCVYLKDALHPHH